MTRSGKSQLSKKLLVRQSMSIIANFSWRRFVSRCFLCFAFACGWMDGGAYRVWAVGSNGLGATFDADETHITFRVYSSRATRIEVWLYDQPVDSAEKASVALDANPQSGIWSKSIAVADLAAKGIAGTIYYDYRAWGPNWPFDPAWKPGSTAGFITDVDDAGNRFDPNKTLLDPYALEVSHDPKTPQQPTDEIYCSGSQERAIDTGRQAARGIVLKPEDVGATADAGAKPTRPFKDEIIYEVNLRGLTKNDPSVAMRQRGTYLGAAQKAAYLKSLGITAVEFLPLQEFQNDTNDLIASTDGNNYWGYDPEDYFAPDRHYAADQSPGGPTREFKAMVKAFHDQGLKVYVDMVYNHTAEGDADSPGDIARILSWRGLDNGTYYELTPDHHHYWNNNGVGANVNTANPVVRQEIMDALAYWKDALGVDGFRFDLAPVLGNTFTEGGFRFDKFNANNVLNRAVRELPVRPAAGGAGVDLIAEPWGIGDGTFQLGSFPSGWAEWNGFFRDSLRTSQNKLGVAKTVPAELATRFAGSADLFQSNGRKPWHSVNFLVAHDGFTLRDLYSYNNKQNNQAYPFGPSDGGTDDNISWDQGGDPALQRQAARTGLAILMLSAGVPMITGGDEMYRTQFGNNNAYNVDTDKNYLDYSNAQTFAHFFNYGRKLMAFRNAHPSLRPADFFKGKDSNGNGIKDIAWLQDNGEEAGSDYLNNPDNHFLAYRIDGTELGDNVQSIYVAYNGWKDKLSVTLPINLNGKHWFRVCDTADWMESQDNFKSPGEEDSLTVQDYTLAGRSLLILIEK
jgi:isoamylase